MGVVLHLEHDRDELLLEEREMACSCPRYRREEEETTEATAQQDARPVDEDTEARAVQAGSQADRRG